MSKEENFCELMENLCTISNLIQLKEKTPQKYGGNGLLHATEVHTIEIIGNNKTITSSEIAQEMNITNGAVAQTISKLTTKNLISKTCDKFDNRKNIIMLTKKGEAIYKIHHEMNIKKYELLLTQLNSYNIEDIEKFNTLILSLIKIYKNL